jgi:hypothetical protein
MGEENIKELLEQAINAVYNNLTLDEYNFDEEAEVYDMELTNNIGNKKKIRVGFRDIGKKRNFDVIPLYVMNAPLGLVEIFTIFVQVYWDARENDRTIMESLAAMISDEISDSDLQLKIKKEKLVQ